MVNSVSIFYLIVKVWGNCKTLGVRKLWIIATKKTTLKNYLVENDIFFWSTENDILGREIFTYTKVDCKKKKCQLTWLVKINFLTVSRKK